eukprot:g7808.t1
MKVLCLFLLLLETTTKFCTAYFQFQHTLVPINAESQSTIIASKRATSGRYSEQGCRLMGEVLNIKQHNVTVYDPDSYKKKERTVTFSRGRRSTQRQVQFSHTPSGGVLLHEEISNRWYMIYQFESPNPGTMYRLWLRLVNDTQISTKLNIPINMSPFSGLWKPRVSIQTPTNTMLGAEGIPPDGRLMEEVKCLDNPRDFECLINFSPATFYDIMDFMRYFDRPPADLKRERRLRDPPSIGIPGFKPYRYGYPYELQLGLNEQDRVLDVMSKLYAMGRVAATGLAVMQNGFTVYMSGGNGGLFRFVDEVGGFRNGELAAAKITLRSANSTSIELVPGLTFDIQWVPLGIGDADSLMRYVSQSSDTKFSDLFGYKEPVGGICPRGYELAVVGNMTECLQVRNERLAAFLEPARMGALNGATMSIFHFSQMATKLDAYEFYLGVSSIEGGRIGVGKGKDTVNIEPNTCGCVFKVIVDRSYQAQSMEVMVCGEPLETKTKDGSCSTEALANPRALTYAHNFDQVLVGEDSNHHPNNFIWALDLYTYQLVRIFHAPREGRITSLSWLQDVIGGNNYIGLTVANPHDVLGWMSYFGSFELAYNEAMAFSDVAVPYDDGPKKLPIGFGRVTSGETSSFSGFTEVIKTGMRIRGKKIDNILIGELLDSKLTPVDDYLIGPVEPQRLKQNEVAHRLGFTSMINSCGTVYVVTATNSLPSMNYVVELTQGKNQLVPVSAAIVDWSLWGGLWRSGGGTVSEWNTYLSGEIHEPDALDFLGYQCITGFSSCFKSQAESSFYESIKFLRYNGLYISDLKNKFGAIEKNFNPYSFGYAYEVKVNKEGCVNPQKYLTLGRFSHGGISVMPDGKTVYMTDWTEGRSVGGGFYRFVADKPEDLTSGSLYAAKFKPVTGTNTNFKLEWIFLGHASNEELRRKAKRLTFIDIFDYIPSSKSCRLQQINVKSEIMCIRVKKGMEKYAAFFETRRYAALKGATIELANTKGITFDAFSARLYISFSSITSRDRIMLQNDIEGSSNDLRFPSQPCGCIYSMSLTTSYEAFNVEKLYCGTNLHGTSGENACSVEHPAGSKDLAHIPGHGQLLVAEDSCDIHNLAARCGHVNNALWSVSVDTSQEFTRILTSPKLKSVSSPYWNRNIEGDSYLTVTIDELYNNAYTTRNRKEPAAVFGYLGPIKQTDRFAKDVDPVCYNKRAKGDQCFTTSVVNSHHINAAIASIHFTKSKFQMSSKRKLEPTGVSLIEHRLQIVREDELKKKPKISRQPRSKLFTEVQSLLPKMENADKQLQQKMKSGNSSELDLEVITDKDSACIEMVLDCGLFDSLNPEVNFENALVKQILDEQLDKLTETQLFQLSEYCSETHNEESLDCKDSPHA